MQKQLLPGWPVFWKGYFSLAFAASLLIGTSLVPEWGLWYGQSRPYRQQTDSFLRGEISIGRDPSAVQHDYTWANGQANQVWGLAVPALRLPFEAAARLFGFGGFPDRIVFGFYYFLLAILGFSLLPGFRSNSDSPPTRELAGSMVSVMFLLLLPQFITVCQSRFEVWEEAVAYLILGMLGQFFLLWSLWERPTRLKFLCLAALAGLGPMIRPTALFYSVPTILLAAWRMRREGKSTAILIWGGVLFVAGGGLLFLTNWMRFGSGLEFGHRINVTEVHSLFLTRFENPYSRVSFLVAARELLGATFFDWKFNGFGFFEQEIFPGQASASRWREFYMSTFHPWHLALLVAAWGIGLRQALWKRVSGNWMVFWSLGSFIGLFGFYLWVPALTSRYIMDFVPSVAVGIVFIARFGLQAGTRWHRWLAGSGLVLLWGLDLGMADMAPTHMGREALNAAQVQSYFARHGERAAIPEEYSAQSPPRDSHIDINGRGWNATSGEMQATVSFFCNSPDFIELEMARTGAEKADDLKCFRARVGLEELRRQGISTNANNHIVLRFDRPGEPRYQSGPQLVFVATMPAKEVGRKPTSDFKLLRIRWR